MGTEDVRLGKDSWCPRKHFLEAGSLLTLLHFSLEQAEPATACCLLSVNTKRNLKPSILLINTTQCDSFSSHFPFSFPIQNFIFLRVSFHFGGEYFENQVNKTKLILYICRVVYIQKADMAKKGVSCSSWVACWCLALGITIATLLHCMVGAIGSTKTRKAGPPKSVSAFYVWFICVLKPSLCFSYLRLFHIFLFVRWI